MRELRVRALSVRLALAVFLVAGSCTTETEPRAEPSPPATPSPISPTAGPPPEVLASGPVARRTCRLPHRHLLRIWRGYEPERSGELQLVPAEPNVIGPGFPHAGVADHLQDVPMLVYGPGLIEPGRRVPRPVTVADVAPTIAELIDFALPAPDGAPLREALVRGAGPARLVITLVWDGGGRGVLDEWPDGWPNLRRLIGEGTWYERVTVGSSPSTSAPIHATIGTGTFPKRHGLIENAQVQLGLLGHGSTWGGGDRDIAVLKRVAGTRTRTGSGESHRRAGPPSPRPGT